MKKNKPFIHSNLLFRELWDISADGMRLTDKNGTILTVNDAFCKIAELDKEKVENQLLSVTYLKGESQRILATYRDDFKNNVIETRSERQRTIWNGKPKWLEFSNSYLEIPGTGKLLLSIIKDITQRKEAEIALAKSEQRYRILFNNANDAVFLNYLSPENKFSTFIEVNDIACRKLIYSREDLLNQSLFTIIPDNFHERLREITKLLKTEKHVIFEVNFLTSMGMKFPVEVSSHLFYFNDKEAFLSIARDITERKQSDRRLRAYSQQLRDLASRLQNIREEERTMIAREIHDELGQVLSVLKIQVALISNKLRDDQADLKEKTNSITNLIDQTVESVQQISAKLRPGLLDELGLIAAIQWQAEDFQEKTGIQCRCSVPDEEVNTSREQATAIFRILQEALTNVARHAEAGKVSIFLKRRNAKLVLEVTDNGVGISQNRINDPQSLGLLGMKERAFILGGDVKINGAKGKGTNVKVLIPLEKYD